MTTTFLKVRNAAGSALDAGIDNSQTTFNVEAGDGPPFAPDGSSEVHITVGDIESNFEIMTVTGVSTDTLTVTRAQEGTSGQSFLAAVPVRVTWTAAYADDITAAINNIEDGTTRLDSITGAIDSDLTISSDKDIILQLDADNDGASEEFQIKDGAGATVFAINEGGQLKMLRHLLHMGDEGTNLEFLPNVINFNTESGTTALQLGTSIVNFNEDQKDININMSWLGNNFGFYMDGLTGRISQGKNTGSYGFNAVGDIDTEGVYRVNGTEISSSNLTNDSAIVKNTGAVTLNSGSADVDFVVNWDSGVALTIDGTQGDATFGGNLDIASGKLYKINNVQITSAALSDGASLLKDGDVSISGNMDVASGKVYKINDVQITSAALSDGASLVKEAYAHIYRDVDMPHFYDEDDVPDDTFVTFGAMISGHSSGATLLASNIVNEVQTLTIGASETVSFRGQATSTLSPASTAQEVEDALNLLSTISAAGGSVSVTGGAGTYVVTFDGGTDLIGIDLPLLNAAATGDATEDVKGRSALLAGSAGGGIYHVDASVTLKDATTPDKHIQVRLSKNGSYDATLSIAHATMGNNDDTSIGVSGLVTLADGDYIEIEASSDGSLADPMTIERIDFTAHRVSNS